MVWLDFNLLSSLCVNRRGKIHLLCYSFHTGVARYDDEDRVQPKVMHKTPEIAGEIHQGTLHNRGNVELSGCESSVSAQNLSRHLRCSLRLNSLETFFFQRNLLWYAHLPDSGWVVELSKTLVGSLFKLHQWNALTMLMLIQTRHHQHYIHHRRWSCQHQQRIIIEIHGDAV